MSKAKFKKGFFVVTRRGLSPEVVDRGRGLVVEDDDAVLLAERSGEVLVKKSYAPVRCQKIPRWLVYGNICEK